MRMPQDYKHKLSPPEPVTEVCLLVVGITLLICFIALVWALAVALEG